MKQRNSFGFLEEATRKDKSKYEGDQIEIILIQQVDKCTTHFEIHHKNILEQLFKGATI